MKKKILCLCPEFHQLFFPPALRLADFSQP